MVKTMVKQINQKNYHEDSKKRTRKMQRVAWQFVIPGKSNNTAENRNQKESQVNSEALVITSIKGCYSNKYSKTLSGKKRGLNMLTCS